MSVKLRELKGRKYSSSYITWVACTLRHCIAAFPLPFRVDLSTLSVVDTALSAPAREDQQAQDRPNRRTDVLPLEPLPPSSLLLRGDGDCGF